MLEGLGRGRSSVLVVEGQSGMGTGALVRRGCVLAGEAGVRVAYARGSRYESTVDFGLASQLSAQVTGPGQPRWGNDLAAVLCEEVLAEARRSPLLVAVDDAHFIDSGSARWLNAVVRRMTGTPLVLVLAVSSGTDQEPALRGLAERVLEAGPLTSAGVRQVLAAAFGEPPHGGFVSAVAHATGGVPSVVHAVAHRLAATGTTPVPAAEPLMRAMTSDALGERLARILDGLPDELVTVVRTIAVCGGSLDFELVCSVAGVEGMSSAGARSRLRRAGLLNDDPRPALAGWVPADQVLAAMDADAREKAQAVVAELCHRNAVPDDVVADILLDTRPVGDPWAAGVLRDVATRRTELGDTVAATRLLGRALREPVTGSPASRILFDLGEAEVATVPFASDRHLARVITAPAGPDVDALRVRAADLVLSRGDHALVGRLTAEVCEREDVAPEVRGKLLALHWLSQDRMGDTPEGAGSAAVGPLPEVPDDPAQAAVVAWRLALKGQDVRRTRALARTALLADGRDACPLAPRTAASVALDLAGMTDEASAGLEAAVADFRLPHDRSAVAYALLVRVGVSLRHDLLDAAARDLDTVLTTMPEQCWHPRQWHLLEAMRLLVHARSGELVVASRRITGTGYTDSAVLLYARGVVRLLNGDAENAVGMLLECGRLLLNAGLANPLVIPWRADAATASRVLGHDARADDLQSTHDALTRTWFADTGRALL